MRRTIKIVLVPGFSYLSLGAILEPIHTLNKLYPDLMIEYELISISEEKVISESGISINCFNSLQEALKEIKRKANDSVLFLCFFFNIAQAAFISSIVFASPPLSG